MRNHLDWFTSGLHESGQQLVHIRPERPLSLQDIVPLDLEQSRLLMAVLDQLANERSIPWCEARQAVLRGFRDVLRPV